MSDTSEISEISKEDFYKLKAKIPKKDLAIKGDDDNTPGDKVKSTEASSPSFDSKRTLLDFFVKTPPSNPR